jgi:hypothetical protein
MAFWKLMCILSILIRIVNSCNVCVFYFCTFSKTLNLFKETYFITLKKSRLLKQGILKGEVSLYHWPPVWLVWNQLYDNWQFLIFLQNRLIQISRTGGQWYSYTPPFSIPCLMILPNWPTSFLKPKILQNFRKFRKPEFFSRFFWWDNQKKKIFGLNNKNILTIVSDNRKWCLYYKCSLGA